MDRIVLIVSVLLSGCFSEHLLSGLDRNGPTASVCVHGDAGSCCGGYAQTCTVFDKGCEVGAKLPRPPIRCLLCAPEEITDGSPRDPHQPPPNLALDSGTYEDGDGGVRDSRMSVCGPATYLDP